MIGAALIYFVEQFDRVADVTVEFVDEADDRRVTQTADVHQRDGAWLYTLTAIEDHQCRVNRCQGAVGIFGEVFVARGVEQVDHVVAIRELHDRRGNGNTPLFFHFHPVGGGMAVGFSRFHRARNRNRLAHQQELLGDGGFTGIGVGNNGKRAPGVDFIDNFTIGHRLKSRLCTLKCTQLKKNLWPIAKANTDNRPLYQTGSWIARAGDPRVFYDHSVLRKLGAGNSHRTRCNTYCPIAKDLTTALAAGTTAAKAFRK